MTGLVSLGTLGLASRDRDVGADGEFRGSRQAASEPFGAINQGGSGFLDFLFHVLYISYLIMPVKLFTHTPVYVILFALFSK
mgnify:CR=1 FL=1